MSKKKESSWFPFYYKDFILDTGHLSHEEKGIYLDLLMYYYLKGEPLPQDDLFLSKQIGCFTRKSKKLMSKILQTFFLLCEKTYRHQRCDEEIAKRTELIEKRKLSGIIGNEIRWKNTSQMGSQMGSQTDRKRIAIHIKKKKKINKKESCPQVVDKSIEETGIDPPAFVGGGSKPASLVLDELRKKNGWISKN